MNFLKKHWLPVLLAAGALFVLWNTSPKFQQALGGLWNRVSTFLVSLAALFILGEVLIGVFELPVLAAVAAVVLVGYGTNALWGWFTKGTNANGANLTVGVSSDPAGNGTSGGGGTNSAGDESD